MRPEILFLILSIAALAVAPLLLGGFGRTRLLRAFLDGFMVLAIGWLVLFSIFPHALELAGGWIALPVALLGLFGPTLLERARHRAARGVHAVALHLAMAGLLVHGFLDGAGLTSTANASGDAYSLPLAIVLHRFAEGLTIWRLLVGVNSFWVAACYLFLLGVTTVVGFFAGDSIFPILEQRWIGIFQALVGGSLLHVLVHTHEAMPGMQSARGERAASGMGAIGAILLAVFFFGGDGHSHGHEHAAATGGDFLTRFLVLATESAPYLLVGFLLAGLIAAYLPHATFAWMGRGSVLTQSLRGVAFGLPLPICSCGVVPLFQTLGKAGVPAAATMSFLVAAPELGIDSALLTFRLMGGEFAIARIAAAGCVAILFGVMMGYAARRFERPDKGARPPLPDPFPAGSNRLAYALRTGLIEMMDTTGPWILLGLLIAAFCDPFLDREWMSQYPHLQVPLLAIIGIPIYVCASGATPVMATFVAHGLSPGAALAFLLTGPATNATTFGVIGKMYGAKLAWLAAICMAALAIAAGLVVNLAAPAIVTPPLDIAHSHGLFATPALIVLAALLVASLLRRGPREFIYQVIENPSFSEEPGRAHRHEHGHDHGHEHEQDRGVEADGAHGAGGAGGSCCHPSHAQSESGR